MEEGETGRGEGEKEEREGKEGQGKEGGRQETRGDRRRNIPPAEVGDQQAQGIMTPTNTGGKLEIDFESLENFNRNSSRSSGSDRRRRDEEEGEHRRRRRDEGERIQEETEQRQRDGGKPMSGGGGRKHWVRWIDRGFSFKIHQCHLLRRRKNAFVRNSLHALKNPPSRTRHEFTRYFPALALFLPYLAFFFICQKPAIQHTS